MKMMRIKRKLNNKGLSLVEIIIAMVILTVAIVPTLRIFSTTTGYNAKARKNMQAITVAESVMENFKAYSVEDLCKQFHADGKTYCKEGESATACPDMASHGTAQFNMTYDSAHSKVTASGTMMDSNNKLVEAVDNFRFDILGCQEESRKYNVRVDVKKVAAYDDKVLRTEPINKYTDAVIMIDESNVTGVYGALKTLAETYVTTNFSAPSGYVANSVAFESNKINSLDRVITVTAGNGSVEYGVQYTYNIDITYSYRQNNASGVPVPVTKTFSGITGTYDADLSDGAGTPVYSMVAFDSSGTGAALKNIYFYYYPLYADFTDLKIYAATDRIDFVNNSSNIITAHVSRQRYTTYSATKFNSYESAYKLTVTGGGSKGIKLQHNSLNKKIKFVGVPEGYISSWSISGFVDNDVAKTAFESAVQNKKALLYQVDVYVFDESDTAMTDLTKALATFSGTKND